MAAPHDTILANCAKSALGPLGFRGKGRSRTWIADHGWWANVVEFQPSSWSKGSYLNVAAHWMWSPGDHLSFDYGGRIEEFVEYVSDEQFSEAANQLAAHAALEAVKLECKFASIPATASALLDGVNTNDGGGWQLYHAAIAAGLADWRTEAATMFNRAYDVAAASNPAHAKVIQQLAKTVDEPARFKNEVGVMINRHRAALKWPPLDGNPFPPSP